MVVLPREDGAVERTLRSLANQTLVDFEVVLPGAAATRTWVAYLAEGDVLYPFHLEALRDALQRMGAEAIYADGWIAGSNEPAVHPDAAQRVRGAPLLLAGWMHHASVDRERLWAESVPVHWPRLTWEMATPPVLPVDAPLVQQTGWNVVEAARAAYRWLVPYETRVGIDRRVREVVGRKRPVALEATSTTLVEHLEAQIAVSVEKGRFTVESRLPPVVMFNAVAWNSVVQRQHHFARGLAVRGHAVFWIDPALSPGRFWRTTRPLQEVAPGVFLVRLPGSAPDVYGMQWEDAAVDEMAAALVQTAVVYGLEKVVALVNYPRWQPLVTRLHERCGWKVASDCLDDQQALADLYETVLGRYEERLIDEAELLITSSVVLQQRLRSRESLLLHNGNDYDLFSSGSSVGHLRDLPRPVIGFFGVLADWLDMELVNAAAKAFPEWTFVYIGPYTFSREAVELAWLRCSVLPNIVVLPHMAPRRLAAHLAEFDVCTMPFRDIAVTQSMNPVKIYEYLAAGKPVVSRDLPEVRHLLDSGAEGLVALYATPGEFFERLREALAGDSDELRERRQRFARENDWAKRIDVLSRALTGLISR